jgi:hypothetical protein
MSFCIIVVVGVAVVREIVTWDIVARIELVNSSLKASSKSSSISLSLLAVVVGI